MAHRSTVTIKPEMLCRSRDLESGTISDFYCREARAAKFGWVHRVIGLPQCADKSDHLHSTGVSAPYFARKDSYNISSLKNEQELNSQ